MLPKEILDEYIDPGVRESVINLNRIPRVNTMTTCEGHVWRQCPAHPSKDGWIHVSRPLDQHKELIHRIQEVINPYDFFIIEDNKKASEKYGFPLIETVIAQFEDHDFGALFTKISPEEQQAYWARADKRKKEFLDVWGKINKGVLGYMRQTIHPNPEELPYRQT